jgi:hypothetical protein
MTDRIKEAAEKMLIAAQSVYDPFAGHLTDEEMIAAAAEVIRRVGDTQGREAMARLTVEMAEAVQRDAARFLAGRQAAEMEAVNQKDAALQAAMDRMNAACDEDMANFDREVAAEEFRHIFG